MWVKLGGWLIFAHHLGPLDWGWRLHFQGNLTAAKVASLVRWGLLTVWRLNPKKSRQRLHKSSYDLASEARTLFLLPCKS